MDSCLKNKCEQCHKCFTQKSSLNRHVKEQHLKPKTYICGLCKSRFSKKYNLQVHTEKIHLKGSERIKCSQCSCSFTKSNSYKKHLKDHHLKPHSSLNICSELCNETDPESLAESVLKELKQLQQDIQTIKDPMPNFFENEQDRTNTEKSTVQIIIVKDNLYPLGHSALIKTQTIKRSDGFQYLICEFCSKEFRKTYNFLRHRRIHTKLRPFVCVLCKAKFPTTSQLKEHCTIHKLSDQFGVFHKLYKCPKCNEAFNALQQLDKHISTSSDCKIAVQCPKCLKIFTNLKTLLRHKHSEKDNELEMLKAILPEPLTLDKQLPSSSKNNSFDCNICGIDIKEKISFKHHVKRHENLFSSQCVKCQKSFASMAALKVHNKMHRSVKTFKCRYCTNCYTTPQSCSRHMTAHIKQLLQRPEDKDYFVLYPTFVKNGETSQTEANSISFIKPRRNLKEGKRNSLANLIYKCSQCEKSFRYKCWLKKHFKYKHTNELPFICHCCMRGFRTKQSLGNHLLIHSTERMKLTCQVCGRQYASSKSLKLHLRIHTQEKPFSCKICNLTFRTSGHIIQHNKSHHSLKS